MWNLKKGQNELLCRTDTDSQTLKNLWFPKETVWGEVGGCAGVVGWKSYKIGLWRSLYNYHTVGGIVNWYNHCGKQYGDFSEN